MYYHLIVQTFEKCPSEQNPQKCPSNMMLCVLLKMMLCVLLNMVPCYFVQKHSILVPKG